MLIYSITIFCVELIPVSMLFLEDIVTPNKFLAVLIISLMIIGPFSTVYITNFLNNKKMHEKQERKLLKNLLFLGVVVVAEIMKYVIYYFSHGFGSFKFDIFLFSLVCSSIITLLFIPISALTAKIHYSGKVQHFVQKGLLRKNIVIATYVVCTIVTAMILLVISILILQ